MKKVLKKFNRTLSIMLAAAMVLTMVPQTAMPVLAAENEVVEAQTEAPAEDSAPVDENNGDEESADVGKTGETPENPANDEQKEEDPKVEEEPSGDNETPVIDPDQDPVDDTEVEEPVEDPAGEVVDPTIDPDLDPAYTINSDVTPQADELAAPVITLKQGDKPITSGARVLNGAKDVTFELKAATGTPDTAKLYYNIGETDPTDKSTEYKGSAVEVTAPTETTEKTVTIKAIAYIGATGTEGEEGYVAAQTSTVATATVVFQEKGKTITVMDGSDAATVTIGGMEISETAEYPITATTKDIEVAVSAEGKMFEVLYSLDGGTNTSALKKGKKASNPYADRAVSYGSGTYIIPKAALTSDVKIVVSYLKEITLDWQDDAGWESVHAEPYVTRVETSSQGQHVGIWGAQYSATKEEKSNVLFAPQNTKVELGLTPVDGVDFTFTAVSYKKTGESGEGTPATITDDKDSASLEIADIGSDDYTVTIKGTSTTYSRTVVEDSEKNRVPFNRNVGNINPREEYTIRALMTGGNSTYPIDSIEVKVGKDDAVAKNWVELKKVETEESTEENRQYTGTYTLKATKDVGGKTLSVTVKGAEDRKLTTFSLKVAPVISKVAVAKATGANKDIITQTIGTSVDYVVTPTTQTSADVLGVQVTDNAKNALDADGVTLTKAANGTYTLTVVTNATTAGDGVAKIAIYNQNDQAEGASEIEPLTTLTVNTSNPAWAGKTAPTVKLVSSTDVELALDITLPNTAVVPPVDSQYFYKIDPKVVGTDDAAITGAKYYAVPINDSKTSRQKVQVFSDFGKGHKATFNVEVTLVQAIEKPAAEGASTQAADEEFANGDKTYTILAASPMKALRCETKDVYYSEKLTLKKEKAASGLYTGQSAVVATVGFDKLATYTRDEDVTVEVLDASGKALTGDAATKLTVVQSGDGQNAVDIKDGKVTLQAEKGLAPGKYKIRVTQKPFKEDTDGTRGVPEGAITATATMDVTVVQGIEAIEASDATIYVNNTANKGKDGKAKIVPVLNGGEAANKPKTAKVAYELGTVDENNKFTKAEDGIEFVTLKQTGEVVVSKKYVYSAEENNDKFAVRIIPNDFTTGRTEEAEKTEAIVNFTISTEAQKLGQVVLVNGEGKALTAADNNTYTADQLKAAGVTVKVLEVGKTLDDSNPFVDESLYTLTFSDKKNIGLNKNGSFFLNPAIINKTVKVNAQTTDGGNQKTSAKDKTELAFTVTYEKVVDKTAKLEIIGIDGAEFTGEKPEATVTVPTGTVINLKAVGILGETAAEGVQAEDLKDHLVDYKITAGKGAKIVSGNGTLEVGIQMTAKEATVKLSDMKGAKDKTVEYKIKNNNFADLANAPKVSVAKNAKLYAGYQGADHTQDLDFTVKKLSADPAEAVTHVKVSAAADKDSQSIYNAIVDKTVACTVSKAADGGFTLTFESNLPVVKKATLYFDFYNVSESQGGDEDATGQASPEETLLFKTSAAVTVKTEVLKKSYKLTNKYTMSAIDKASVSLVASGKPTGVAIKDGQYQVTFDGILNANIKGRVNDFTKAFTLNAQDGVLTLANPGIAKKDAESSRDKKNINNLIGFVKYTVTYEDNTTETFTTQITITRKDEKEKDKAKTVQNLKATKATVLAEANITTKNQIRIMAGNNGVDLAVAEYVAGDKKGKSGDSNFASVDVTSDNDGFVTVNYTGTPKAGTWKGILYVVPEDSFYAAEAKTLYTAYKNPSNTGDADTQADAETWEDYKEDGRAIAVPVDIVVKPVNDKGKKIKISASKIGFDNTTGVTKAIPYEFAVSATLDEENPITVAVGRDGKNLAPDWIHIGKATNEDKISVVIEKDAYALAVKKSYNSKTKKYPDNGKKVSATVQFNFAAEGAVADTFKLDITPMKLTEDELNSVEVPVATAVEITTPANGAKLTKGATTVCAATVTGENLTDAQKSDVTWEIVLKKGETKKEGTKFEGANLTIDENEELSEITIQATASVPGADNKPVTAQRTVTLEAAAGGGGAETP